MTTDAVGGVWTYALELCRSLPDCKFLFANMGPLPSDSQLAELSELRNVQILAENHLLEWQDDPWNDLQRAGKWLIGIARAYKPDLVHLNGYVHAALNWKAPVIVVAHSCVLSWWRAVRNEDAPATWNRYAAAVQTGLASARCVIAPSKTMARAIGRHYGIHEVTVIPNGRSQVYHETWQERQPIILAAGRMWDEAKNLSCLENVAGELDWPILVAGDQGESDHHDTKLQMLGRCDRSTMNEWLSKASIFAHPARYEPFGLAPLEAAMSGCALVVSNIPSLREIWADAAIFVDPDDHAGWAAILAKLSSDQSLRESWAEKSAARAQRFTSRRMAETYRKLYMKTLNPAEAIPS